MFNKKLLCKLLAAFTAAATVSGSWMANITFAAPESGNEIKAEEIQEEVGPVGGWEPVEVKTIEKKSGSNALRSHRKIINSSLDDIFSKGAGSVGYNSLTSDAMRTFYNSLSDAGEEFMNSVTSVSPDSNGYYYAGSAMYSILGLSRDEALQVFHAYDYDHPAYYWISNTVCTDGYSLYMLTEEEYASPADRKIINNQIIDGVKAYAALAAKGEDTLDKISIIHDQIINDVDYAYESDNKTPESEKWAHSVHGVFDPDHKQVVCEGYADTFSLMMNYMGIPNYYIVGTAGSGGAGGGGGHAWNAVYDDTIGKYMYMDLTWDDLGARGYYNNYFGMPKSDFEQTHHKYLPSNSGSHWLYDVSGDYTDRFEETYYYRGGFFSNSTDYSGFAKKINAKVHRFGTFVSFLAKDMSALGNTVQALCNSSSFSYYPTEYNGYEYYLYIKDMTDDIDLSQATITLNKDSFTYTGSAVKPTVKSVVLNGIKLIDDNYTVSYENNTAPGTDTAKVIVTGSKRFKGTAAAKFTITGGTSSDPTESQEEPTTEAQTDPTETQEDSTTEAETDPTESQEDPTETQEDPTTEAETDPTESQEDPTETQEDPTESQEDPTESQEDPTETQEDPTESQEDPTESQEDPTETQEDPSDDQGDSGITPAEPETPVDNGDSNSSGNTTDGSSNFSTVIVSNDYKVTYPVTITYSGLNRKSAIQDMLTIQVNGEEKSVKKISVKKSKNAGTAVITKMTLSDGTKLKKLSIPVEIVKYTVRTEDIMTPVTEKKIKVSIPGGKIINVSSKYVSIDEAKKTITFNTKNLTGTCSY